MRLVLGPFPWEVRGVRQLPVLAEILVWWALLPSLWRGLRVGFKRRGRVLNIVIWPVLTTAVLLVLSVGNFGTQLRERLQLIVLVVPCLAFGLALRARRSETTAAIESHEVRPPLAPTMEPA
jgi:hypothetical protein